MDEIEQKREEWRKKAQEVGKQVVAPRAGEIDAKGEFPWDIVDVFCKGRVPQSSHPEGVRGKRCGYHLFLHRGCEEIAKYCASSSLLVIVQAVGTMPIALGGTDELKKKFLTRIVERGETRLLLSDRT